jgi:ribosomal protein S18 acetylase RimI-like enzyme
MTLPGGVSLRPIDPHADLAVVSALCAACDVADVGEPDIPQEWIVQAWRGPAFGGAWLAERDGRAVAYLELEWRRETRGVEMFVPVLPDERAGALRASLLTQGEAHAHELVAGLEWLRAVGTATDPTFARDCVSAGYVLTRTWWHMERSIDPAPDPEHPDGVSIRASTGPEDDPVLHEIIETAFVGHFGNVSQSLESWQAENADFLQDRELVLIASADGEPAGVATLLVPDGVGWVGELAVLPRFRGRGIGRALLLAGFRALAAHGATTARLNVDGQNETGATRLYASVGMQVRREFSVYEKRLRADE